MLELLRERPNWLGALSVALTRLERLRDRHVLEAAGFELSESRPVRAPRFGRAAAQRSKTP